MQLSLGQSRQKMRKMCSTLQSGRMVLPAVSGKKHSGRLKDNPWSSGVRIQRLEAYYIQTEKKVLATYEGFQAASVVISTKVQLLLAS